MLTTVTCCRTDSRSYYWTSNVPPPTDPVCGGQMDWFNGVNANNPTVPVTTLRHVRVGWALEEGSPFACSALSGTHYGISYEICTPCPTLSNPVDGVVTPNSGVTYDVATYSCNSGFNLVGSATRTFVARGGIRLAGVTCVRAGVKRTTNGLAYRRPVKEAHVRSWR